MSNQINLKEIERKAYLATFQDGLWDIMFGLVVVAMALFMYRPETGFRPTNVALSVLTVFVANLLFQLGKRYITLPRMGLVKFGPMRKRKMTRLAIVLGVIVLLQVVLLGLTAFGWLNPEAADSINSFLASRDLMDVAVAAISALIVGVSFSVIAFFNDFTRGFYIALLASLATFLMIYLNQPLYPILIGALILLPGLVLFVRFLRAYPLPREASYE